MGSQKKNFSWYRHPSQIPNPKIYNFYNLPQQCNETRQVLRKKSVMMREGNRGPLLRWFPDRKSFSFMLSSKMEPMIKDLASNYEALRKFVSLHPHRMSYVVSPGKARFCTDFLLSIPQECFIQPSCTSVCLSVCPSVFRITQE